MPTYARLGIDLALTPAVGVESERLLVTADSWHALDLAAAPRRIGARTLESTDLEAAAGRSNLAQALILRLLTPLGDLAHLGHPEYGSRLTELIGRLNDEPTRNLARLYVIQAMDAEPRVRKVDGLVVRVPPESPESVEIELRVLPLHDDEPLTIAIEVTL